MAVLDKEEFCARFVAHMVKMAGFSAFDDGGLVADYAAEVAPSYWSTDWLASEGPEECAEADMDYWGED